jgi:hypothetical protein
MGFRYLNCFNKALLAKRAWRLLDQLDSLCARLLKDKYYPFGKLTKTASIKNSAPYWQGITHGLKLLKQGVVWRIINGKKTRIWRDNWIPRGQLKITRNTTKSRLGWVGDLIDQEPNDWNVNLVRSIFILMMLRRF